MLTQHTKVKQLDVFSKKSSSNNDILLNEFSVKITINNHVYEFDVVSQFLEFLIQGILFRQHDSLVPVEISNSTPGIYDVSLTDKPAFKKNALSISDLNIQPSMLIDWVRQFKSSQTLYKQTGATLTIGALLEGNQLFCVECLTLESAFTKLIGGIIKKGIPYYPIFFLSHRLTKADIKIINEFKPEMVICQSALTSNAVAMLIESNITAFGFCRKNKFNRYSNFHI